MQDCAARYLEPDGINKDQFVGTMLLYLDGPQQREAEETASHSYIEQALRTESNKECLGEGFELNVDRLLHAGLGLTTEAGEFLDALKKHLFYGKPLDLVNLREELGDIMWYLAIACSALDTTFEQEQARNIAKLKARYPDKFTSHKAIERDLTAERIILEHGGIEAQ